MSDTPDPVERRRERGRRSQAAFRKRQAQASKHLESENRRLKDALQQILHASRGDDTQQLIRTIDSLAGIIASDTDTQQPCKALSQDSSDDLSFNLDSGDFTLRPRRPWTDSQDSDDLVSQRLNVGMWLDPLHYTRFSLPPEDIIPYLGPGAHTFAGQLFWSLMDHARKQCKHDHPGETTTIKNGLAHSKVMKDIKPSFIRAMVEARVEYKKTGSISPRYGAAAEPDLSTVVHDQVEEDYRASGKDSSRWLSCIAVENRVRIMLGGENFGLLHKAMSGHGDAILQSWMDNVKCRMYDGGICFGDGPRWDVDFVDEIFFGLNQLQ